VPRYVLPSMPCYCATEERTCTRDLAFAVCPHAISLVPKTADADTTAKKRHDFGTMVASKTGNLKAVMKVMGHRDVKTTMKYLHPEIDIVRALLNQDDAATEADA
jgi:site-specific recombinase XerD